MTEVKAHIAGGPYQHYDGLVEFCNEKFAKPGKAIFDGLKKAHLVEGEPFANHINWVWYEIWHHQGRCARHGASMQGPDYTHWHGLFEVGKAFYSEFIPEAQDLVANGIAAGGEKAKAAQEVGALIRATLESDNHKWFIGKMTTEEKGRRAKQREEFAKRYVAKPQIRRRALPSARVMPAGGRAASRAPSS